MTIEQAIGRTVVEARQARGWTQEALAKRVGCQFSTISNLETGGMPTWQTIRDIAQALRMSPGSLISLAESLLPQYERQEAMRAEIRGRIGAAA